ncbi:RNA polymerase sigma factor [Occallatibacter riparius]|uniref:RNA polymerase sigma factor n=1 Tax=Occallatibacter riparius TaxID=1002689 RepID=A0A9J7BTA5_9BACT|nr:RNA polymerase sigma factor [Occallatibacter riparius]UWZ86100.1 RNA polymerase sigma factor [Occallatibacter riparius]
MEEAQDPMMAAAEIVRGAGEEALLLDFRSGSEEAFEALFRGYQREVYGWILRIVRDVGVAEDLTIETFFRIHRAHARFEPERGFGPWARRIATHAALDWLRRQRPEHAMPDEFFAGVPGPGEADPLVTGEIRREVELALRRLPPKLRMAAVLSVIEERPHKEIADALGVTVAAVKLRVFRAMRKLRSELEQKGIKP